MLSRHLTDELKLVAHHVGSWVFVMGGVFTFVLVGAGLCVPDIRHLIKHRHILSWAFDDSCRCSRVGVKTVHDSMSITTNFP